MPSSHLLSAHGTTAADYVDAYPGAEIRCEESRTMWAGEQGGPFALPHWEPIWSPEYVLDRIAEHARLGHPLTSTWIAVNDRNLVPQAFLNHPSWERALLAAGVDPELARLQRAASEASDDWLLRELRDRHRDGLPLDEAHVRTTQTPLHGAIVKRFGTFARGLRAAGIPRKPAAPTGKDNRRDELLREAGVVVLRNGARYARELRQFQARWEAFAMATFGSWRAVAEAAGVSVERLHRSHMEQVYGDARSVLREIQDRFERGVPYHVAAVLGRGGDPGLYEAGTRFFGTYRAAIEAAATASGHHDLLVRGIRPLRGRYPDSSAVTEEIARRARAGLSLNSTVVRVEDAALCISARRYFRAWHTAIRAAGLDPAALGLRADSRRHRPARYPDGVSVVAELVRRVRAGLPVNATGVKVGAAADSALLDSAGRFFGPWEEALRAAGIDPSAVSRPSRRS